MMTSTHGIIGLCLGYIAIILGIPLPEYALLAGLIGGIFPDLDLLKNHRKTFHLPVYYPISFLAILSIYLIHNEVVFLYIGLFLLSATIHTLIDVISGGLAPVEFKKTKAFPVYSHYQEKWISHKIIRYDGSLEDFSTSLIAGFAALYVLNGAFIYITFFLLMISTTYFVFRMRIHRYSLKLLDLN
jgi:hypothetical protein